eukprot:363378-Chlamydomonas_euryale.AAC.31
MVLDEAVEYLRGACRGAQIWASALHPPCSNNSPCMNVHADPEDPTQVTDLTRTLGLAVSTVCPNHRRKRILCANVPFTACASFYVRATCALNRTTCPTFHFSTLGFRSITTFTS